MPHELWRVRGTSTLPSLQKEPETRRVQSIARWMKKAGTSKPLMTIILKAMRAWLQEGILEIEWNFPEVEDHEGLTQALPSRTSTDRMA